jgi:hypothetical protein
MDAQERAEMLRISQECRSILRNPEYSKPRSATLIKWLRSPNAAINDLAGRCLMALGTEAFEDLFAIVAAEGAQPWPHAIWVLGSFDSQHDRLLPYLRRWLAIPHSDIEHQCAGTLASILIARKAAGRPIEQADVDACRSVFERDAAESGWCRVWLRQLQKEFGGA